MKISDDELKKAFKDAPVPEPSKDALKNAVQRAALEFSQKNKQEKKRGKGFLGMLRQMGKSVSDKLKPEGEPIMTRTAFATISVAILAIGVFLTTSSKIHLFPVKKVVVEAPPVEKMMTEPLATVPQADRGVAATQEERADLAVEPAAPPPVQKVERAKAAVAGRHEEMTSAQPLPPKSQSDAKGAARPDRESVAGGRSADSAGETLRESTTELAQDMQIASPAPAPEEKAMRSEKTVSSSARLPQAAFLTNRDTLLRVAPSIEVPRKPAYQDMGRDRFEDVTPNHVKLVAKEPVSTFSIDVDTASYAFVRRQLMGGVLPQKNAVRIEEMINYFDYDYALPKDREQPFQPTVAIYPTPWNDKTRLLHVGIKGYDIVPAKKPRSNLVFLIDVSGSMDSPDKLPLLKNSFAMLVNSLAPEDTVAVVVYAGAAGTVLEPTKVKEKGKILAALDRLQAGGSTAGGEGVNLAYSLAEMNFDKEAVNRVILATDGDFNVGITDRSELKSYIEKKRKTGISLSVLGFGQGNYNDALMQALAQNGNGVAAYIDNLNEARKVLVDEAGSTLFTIANDVKIQVEFNPATVHDYRLIGYETRMLNQEDFNNDKVDAGDVGSGHCVTALYEITPVDSREKLIDPLRYQADSQKAGKVEVKSSEYAFLKIRYKLPGAQTSRLLSEPVGPEQTYKSVEQVPQELRFAAAVAAFGQILRNDPYTGSFSYDDVLKLAEPARGKDQFGYRSEFLNLVRLAKSARAM